MTHHTVLDRILASKRGRLEAAKAVVPLERQQELAQAAPPPRGFADALAGGCAACGGPAVVAELKRASPSAGIIHAELDEITVAKGYEAAGAQALSVLTEEDHFGGLLCDIIDVRDAVGLPVLRKDFITDPYQVWEARAAAADAVLLIASILDETTLAELIALAAELGMDALVEAHDEAELWRAQRAGALMVGINNRDLATLGVDLGTAERLLPLIPEGVVKVAESGVRTTEDLVRMAAAGADAVLIGEALLKEDDPTQALARLTGHESPAPAHGAVLT